MPPPWDPLLMTCGAYNEASMVGPSARGRQAFHDYFVAPSELLYYAEGVSSVVTVGRAIDGSNLWLAIDGKIDASLQDMDAQVLRDDRSAAPS
jgi:hypothetical protein